MKIMVGQTRKMLLALLMVALIGSVIMAGCSEQTSPSDGTKEICAGMSYDKTRQTCCNGTLIDGYDLICKDGKGYNRHENSLCNGKVYPGTDWVDCNGKCYQRYQGKGCCAGQLYNTNDATCIDDKLYPADVVRCGDKVCSAGNLCCNDKDKGFTCYDPNRETCEFVTLSSSGWKN